MPTMNANSEHQQSRQNSDAFELSTTVDGTRSKHYRIYKHARCAKNIVLRLMVLRLVQLLITFHWLRNVSHQEFKMESNPFRVEHVFISNRSERCSLLRSSNRTIKYKHSKSCYHFLRFLCSLAAIRCGL
jgi:hypothetical protein